MSLRESVEANLKARRDGLMQHIQDLENDRRQPVDSTFNAQAVQREDDEVKDQLEDQLVQQLNAVNAALERISDTSFGLCTSCGKEIEKARLLAVPETSLCVECADQSEQSG